MHATRSGAHPAVVRPSMVLGPWLVVATLLAACTAGGDTPAADGPAPPAPPAPPAACLLDTAALATDTGLTWTPDQTTATDTRCVYDPAGSAATTADGPAFVAVEIAALAGEPAARLDTLAELCEPGSRAPVAAADGGFVCRFQGGSVFAALVRRGQEVTVTASAVPAGTTAAGLVVALGQQLSR